MKGKSIKKIRLEAGSPYLNEICPICNRQFMNGDVVELFETSQRRGEIEFNVEIVAVHIDCCAMVKRS